jgi:acetamidase/formamidase
MSFADRELLRHRYPHGPYSMLGPVEVAGAEPGDVIECSITKLRTIGWGGIRSRSGWARCRTTSGALRALFPVRRRPHHR